MKNNKIKSVSGLKGKFSTLSAKLRLLVFIALVPCFGLLIYSTVQQRKIQIKETEKKCLLLSKSVAVNLEGIVEGSRYFLISLSAISEVRSLDSQAASLLFARINKHLPLYANIFALKSNGDIFASAVLLKKAVNSADLSYFSEVVRSHAFSFGGYQIGRIVGRPVIVCAYPVLEESGQLLAVVACSLDLEKIKLELEKILVLKEGVLNVLDYKGTILVRYPDPDNKWSGKILTDKNIATTMIGNAESIKEAIGLDGIKRIYSFVPVKNSGGKIFVSFGILKNDVFKEIDKEFYHNSIWLILILIGSLEATILIGILAKKAEEKIVRLNAVLRSITAINQLIISESDQKRLFSEACKILIQTRRYCLAWIGLVEEGHKRVVIVARAGEHVDYLDKVVITWDDSPTGCGPTGTAIKTRQPSFCRNMITDPGFAPWREEALKRGFAASAVVPLIHGDKVLGVLNVYSQEPEFFSTEEVKLLSELGNDIAFAMHNLEVEKLRQAAEHALKKALDEWKSTFDSIDDLVMVIGNDFNILKANFATSKFLKMPVEKIIGKTCHQLFHFTDVPVEHCPLADVKKTKQHAQTEIHLSNGMWVMSAVDPWFDADGHMIGGIHIISDITERKRIESELVQANEREYRTLIESLPQKVFLKNKNSVYMSCNGNYACDLGIKPEEIVGKTDFDFFPTYLAEKYRADDKKVMESGKTENIEEEYAVISDFLGGVQKTFINTVKVPVRDKAGNIVGIFGLFWDITERKQTQDKLYKSQQMFESIVNGITDEVLLLSVDYKILWANKASIEYFGLTMEEILGKYCYQITHKQEKRCKSSDHQCPIKDIVKMGSSETLIHTHINKKGEPVFVEVIVFPIKDSSGEVIQFLHLQRDITIRKQAEDERKRLDILKTAVEIKLHFTSMVSHELRSPLGAIKEGINLVLEGLAGEINNEQKDLLDTAKRNTDRLHRLINNVLDFQKIESRKEKLKICQNDIRAVALEVSNTMGILAKEKGLNLTVEADDNLPELEFDRDRITQVMTDLVNNAIKYTEKGNITISLKQEASVIHVMVQDSGPGIKGEDMQKLFQAFEQIDDGKGKKKGGTGLGLAISKEIILGHQGEIWAESKEGQGSVFHFTLPIKEHRS